MFLIIEFWHSLELGLWILELSFPLSIFHQKSLIFRFFLGFRRILRPSPIHYDMVEPQMLHQRGNARLGISARLAEKILVEPLSRKKVA